MKGELFMDSKKTENSVGMNLNCPASLRDYDDNFTIETLIQKILKDDRQYDMSKIISAYQFAEEAHKGQKRSSGQDYIIHPLAVAYILLELGMDTDTICAALLHDVIEDTPATFNDLKKRFGQDVAMLVDGVTKLTRMPYLNKNEQQAENIMKILLAMSKDIRIMIIKLSDRLHNMRTLKYCSTEKQKRISYETMSIYVPISHRLGIRALKDELEDLSFYYLDPISYTEIENLLESNKKEREDFIEKIKDKISKRLSTINFIQPPYVDGRAKSIYGIYKKLFVKRKTIDEIYDKYAVRIIVSTTEECYSVMGFIHNMFTPIMSRIKDYISTPKENMYQSIHTTVLGKEGIPFEVQIRTWEMHEIAEYGIAAHWKYKEGIKKDKMEERLSWVRKVIEAQQTSDDVEEIVSIIKADLSPEDIVVMTPNGLPISLPVGANPIDFAYKIHTEIGHRATGAKVDGRMVSLDYELHTSEVCEIITCKDENRGPNRDWLKTVKTNEARSKIRSWFKHERREENIQTGKAQLENEFRKNGINLPKSEYASFLADDLKRHKCETLDDFYASIGYGGISLVKIVPRIKDKYDRLYGNNENKSSVIPVIKPKKSDKNKIILDKVDNLEWKTALCCNPLPTDEVVGYITRGHGLSVHNKNCINYKSALKRNIPEEMQRWVDIEWTEDGQSQSQIQTSFEVIATDRVGLVHDITELLYEARIPIVHSSSRALKNGNALFESTIIISNTDQLRHLFDKIRKVYGVISVERSVI